MYLAGRIPWNSLIDSEGATRNAGLFGDGWRSTYEEQLQTIGGSVVRYWRPNGSSMLFEYEGTNVGYVLISPIQEHALLTMGTGTDNPTIIFPNGDVHTFSSTGELLSIQDRNGHLTSLQYDAYNRLSNVTDPAGRQLIFNYATPTSTVVSSVQDAVGVIAQYTYDGSPSPHLLSVAYADNSSIQFTYTGNLITQVADGTGAVLETHTYNSAGQGLTSAEAGGVNAVTVQSYASGTTGTSIQDSLGNSSTYTPILQGGRSYIAGISGNGCSTCGGRTTQSFQYDPNGNMLSKTDSLSNTTTFTYDVNGDMLTKSTPVGDGTTQQYSWTYNQFGEVLTSTDPLGHTTTNVYDAAGDPPRPMEASFPTPTIQSANRSP